VVIKKILLVAVVLYALVLVIIPLTYADISIASPLDDMYNSRLVPLYVNSDDLGSFYLTRTSNSQEGGTVLCKDTTECRSLIKAKEGENVFWVKFVEDGDITFSDEVRFFVDTTLPKVLKTNMSALKTKYTNGKDISVTYAETDLKSVELLYEFGCEIHGILREDCDSGKKETCVFSDIDLEQCQNQPIEMWFKLTDNAGNSVDSKKERLIVDTIKPVIENIDHSVRGSKVSFSIDIDEKNIKEVIYKDYSSCNSNGVKEGVLCTKLNVNSRCNAYRNFCPGFHDIEIIAKDLAGNEDYGMIKNIRVDP